MQEEVLDRIFNSVSLREELVLNNKECGRYKCVIVVHNGDKYYLPQRIKSNVEIGNLYNSYIYKPSKDEVDKIIIKNLTRHISRVTDLYLTSDVDVDVFDDGEAGFDLVVSNSNFFYWPPDYSWTFNFNTSIKTSRECLKLLFFLKWCFMKDTFIFITDNVTGDEALLNVDKLSLEKGWLHRNKNKKHPRLVASDYTTTVSEELSDYFKIYARRDIR